MGKKDVITGFKFLGFDIFDISDTSQAKEIFDNFKKNLDQYGILYITEDFYYILEEEIQKLSYLTIPAIVIIPNNQGSQNIGINIMKKTVERATGSDMLIK